MINSCGQKKTSSVSGDAEIKAEPANWAERLGYPAGKKVVKAAKKFAKDLIKGD